MEKNDRKREEELIDLCESFYESLNGQGFIGGSVEEAGLDILLYGMPRPNGKKEKIAFKMRMSMFSDLKNFFATLEKFAKFIEWVSAIRDKDKIEIIEDVIKKNILADRKIALISAAENETNVNEKIRAIEKEQTALNDKVSLCDDPVKRKKLDEVAKAAEKFVRSVICAQKFNLSRDGEDEVGYLPQAAFDLSNLR